MSTDEPLFPREIVQMARNIQESADRILALSDEELLEDRQRLSSDITREVYDESRYTPEAREIIEDWAARNEFDRLALAVVEAARGVVAEWTIRGDGGCETRRRDALIAALTAFEDQRTDA